MDGTMGGRWRTDTDRDDEDNGAAGAGADDRGDCTNVGAGVAGRAAMSGEEARASVADLALPDTFHAIRPPAAETAVISEVRTISHRSFFDGVFSCDVHLGRRIVLEVSEASSGVGSPLGFEVSAFCGRFTVVFDCSGSGNGCDEAVGDWVWTVEGRACPMVGGSSVTVKPCSACSFCSAVANANGSVKRSCGCLAMALLRMAIMCSGTSGRVMVGGSSVRMRRRIGATLSSVSRR
jgi:hypothetical protein